MRSLLLALLISLIGFAAPAGAGDFDDGLAAYNAKDYAAALHFWRPLADRGDGETQHHLAGLYANGEGVARDTIAAHMWYTLAASRLAGDARDRAVTNRDTVEARMTPEQVAEAHRLAREWFPKTWARSPKM
ncbi:MAG: hypothetical protein VCC99_06250 [Alphaproteobacteria bacterium]